MTDATNDLKCVEGAVSTLESPEQLATYHTHNTEEPKAVGGSRASVLF